MDDDDFIHNPYKPLPHIIAQYETVPWGTRERLTELEVQIAIRIKQLTRLEATLRKIAMSKCDVCPCAYEARLALTREGKT